MTPSFLKNAKKVGEDSTNIQSNTPSFLKNARKIQEENVTSQNTQILAQQQKATYPSDEEIQKDIERHQARLLSRAGEAFIGAPGDIASFITGLFGKEQGILPTSQSLKETSQKLTGGYTQAKNEMEQAGDELFSDIGSMLIPGAGNYSVARNIGIPLVGTLTKEGLKYLGKDDRDSSSTKIGLMIGLDLLSHRKGGAKKHALDLFEKSHSLVPENAIAEATKLNQSLSNLKRELKRGGERPATQAALKKANEIQNNIKNGKIGMRDLMAYRPSINELISELGGWEVKLPKAIKQKAIKNLQNVKGLTIEAAEDWGKKFSPEFLKTNRSANEAYAAYEQSNKIANFLKKHVGEVKNPAIKLLFGLPAGAGAIYSPTGALITGGAGVGGAGLYQAFKIFHRVQNSPTLRKYYQGVILSASKGQTAQVSKNIKSLDKGLEKQD